MKIVVGLGNPGKEYEQTRHNAGFWVVDELAQRHQIRINSEKFQAIIGEGRIKNEKVILVKPLTYMNLSGDAVRKVIDYWSGDLQDLIVIHDDLDLERYRIRLKAKGNSGGHRGVTHIINTLGSDAFARLKIGIGRPPEQVPVVDYVLAKIPAAEWENYRKVVKVGADAIEVWLNSGIGQAMNLYNSFKLDDPQ